MQFSDVLGLPHIKNHLTTTADRGRIPHAQLFVGPSGSGTLPMAIAYAQYILCQNSGGENDSGIESCNLKIKKLSHPDLHFAFPVASNEKIKKNPKSSDFLQEWRQFLEKDPYGNLYDWYQFLGIENKQGQIGVLEAQEIVKTLSLKSYEGGYKIMIIWMAGKMNTSASNKLLKLIEEPPKDTLFLLVTEEEENIIQTIRSRCQTIHFPLLSEASIVEGLIEKEECDKAEAVTIAHRANGSFSDARKLVRKEKDNQQFEGWFVDWVRTAFKAKGNKAAILKLISWSETIAASGRETQKKFLYFCIEYFRQALLQNYNANSLVFLKPETEGFKLEKFAPFVNGNNILEITKELEDGILHIERNGNPKVILTDLSIKLTRLLHKK